MKDGEPFILRPAVFRERVYPALDVKEAERRKAAAEKLAASEKEGPACDAE
jgi:hypothetical protein